MSKYDILVIGLGPAGMAVTAMASEMGFKVLSIEHNKVGGECSNVGCIPSKALLRVSEKLNVSGEPFSKINESIDHIREKKVMSAVKKADLILNKGSASFIDDKTVQVDGENYTAKHIFIATGTRPLVPPIEGLDKVSYLTNENLFQLRSIPKTMTIIGGGAIGCEMALAFSRLGCVCNMVQDRAHLIPLGEKDAGDILEASFKEKGIGVYNSQKITKIFEQDGNIVLRTEGGIELTAEKLLVAAGRRFDFSSLKLENAGVEYGKRGIVVDEYLCTNKKHIHAVGDCNGSYLLSHAAMHQGMIALMNTMAPGPFKKKYRKYPVPWTVFTEPQVSHVGKTSGELQAAGIDYQTIETSYEDYGAAYAEGIAVGYVRVYVSKGLFCGGKIYGASIVGANSGEMINEWALAMQHNIKLSDIMMTMHSFPTMGFMSKRIGELWMMDKMKSPSLRKLLRLFF